ncbi:transglycosylase SLT domain-containing protein [Acetobacter musti]|uniref:Transglycosylase SLT domain-containing protein n=1 Tax=Acetobacter musti TaxID=864732 RepID=A0ABX0JPM7_9PROT|nr:transglycosylase SLT domain-containing protein [Acetobacter musti]
MSLWSEFCCGSVTTRCDAPSGSTNCHSSQSSTRKAVYCGVASVPGTFRTAGLIGLLALLSACAGQAPDSDMQIPVAQEEAQYRAHAKSYYAPPGPADDPWGPYIQEASQRFDVPELWIRGVIQRESGGRLFHNGELVTSAPGAMGLMQLMPPTYDEIRSENNLGDDPYDPHDNILAGTAYIRQLYDTYGSPGFLAAYNAGPGRLEDFLGRNRTLPRETRNYVAAIGRQIAGTWPNNRSQADLLVASHESPANTAYASAAMPSSTANSVRSAWAHRGSADTGQPVQVAEAPSDGDDTANQTATPAYTHAWAPVARNPESPQAVSAAWSARLKSEGAAQTAGAAAESSQGRAGETSAVWQSRLKSEDTTPVGVGASVSDTADSEEQPTAQPAVQRVSRAAPARFSLVSRAAAATTPVPAGPMHTTSGRSNQAIAQGARDWAIQVGAFSSSSLAQQAASHARARASSDLSGSRAQVASVRVSRGQLFRARLTGLSRAEAVSACRRLDAGASNCVVVSPDAIR